MIDGNRLGFVTPSRAAILARYLDVFAVQAGQIGFASDLISAEQRTVAMASIAADLAVSGAFFKIKGEPYAVKNSWHERARLQIDRALVPGFGFRAYGVHINGFVHKASGLHLWIGTRSMTCSVEPSKFENMVAGDQPAHLGLIANVVKECEEEAGIAPDLARTARPVSNLSYSFDAPEGLKVDTLFCYDLEMPEAIVPANRDGEISAFRLMPIEEALALISSTQAFKFNVSLVIIDFAIRHGVIDPEREPDYEKIVSGLHGRP